MDITYEMGKVNTPEKLRKLIREENITYIIFPYSATYVKDNIDTVIFEYLKINARKEYKEVKEFKLNENYIYIYKLTQ